MMRTYLQLLSGIFFFSVAQAQVELPFGGGGGEEKSVAVMVPEVKGVVAGEGFAVALELQHPEGWHSYYKNTGGVENPPEIEWQLPPGFAAGPIQWPVPEVKDGYFGKSFVYPGSPVFLVDLTVPDSVKVGESVTLRAKAVWQICSQACLNEEQEFVLTLPVVAARTMDPEQGARFAGARAKQAKPLSGWKWSAAPKGAEEIELRLTPEGNATLPVPPAEFVPERKFLRALSDGGSVTRDGGTWVLTLKRALKDMMDEPIPQEEALSGILVGGKPGEEGYFAYAVPATPIAAAGAGGAGAADKPAADRADQPATKVEAVGFGRLMWIFGGMLLGGLLLNLMPCVFPVIGLKIMGFVSQAGDDRRKVVFHGLLFTLGVVVSFGVLSGILLAARAAGLDINWGFQLQEPLVVLGLLLLFFVLALNLSGVFEIGTSATSVGSGLQAKQGLAGSFFSGVLATVVATPCSAPFLGVAIGAAVGLPALSFFAAFGAMAVGLSLPYLVLSVFPHWVDRLPRPGPWMESFKQGMSFLLYGTAAYLLWVYVVQIDAEHMLGPVFGLVLIGLAAWVYGRWHLPYRPARVRWTAVVLALGFAVAGLVLALPPKAEPAATDATATAKLEWQPWSRARVEELHREGRSVYIDFTAKWCLTCQVNKQRAYTPEVVELMRKKGIVALRADKTRANAEIDSRMRELGRSAIPVNVLEVPGKEAVITPELLSPAYLLELFGKEVPDPATSAGS